MRGSLRLLSLLLLVTLLASCGQGAPTDTETATPPTRVAVLFSSLVEVWQAAGGEVTITVGESVARGLVPEGTLLVDSGAGKTVNTELLLAAQPDLIVYSPDIPAGVKAAKTAARAGIRTLPLRVESFADYLAAIETAAAITGDRDAISRALEADAAIRAMLASEKATAARDKSVLFIRAGQTAASTKAKRAEDHFAAAMLGELGLCNIADEAPLLLDGLSTEAILASDPDYIFFSMMGDETGARKNIDSLLSRPEWQRLTAVREGRCIILPRELFHFKPCSRWEEAYAYLIDAISEEVNP